MSAVWRVIGAIFCFSVCVNAQTRSLAVYHDPARHFDSSVLHELQLETQRLLAPAALSVAWRQTGHAGGAFDKIAVASFDGNCSVAELPAFLPPSGPAGVFADTAVDKHWQVQPFFHVNCGEIIRNLRPSLDRLSVPMRNFIFGRALARVFAHEIYHIVAQTRDHAEAGVAKASFSPEDLLTERFNFNSTSLERLRPASLLSGFGN